MADRDNMTVAEMLAAARKADGGGSSSDSASSEPAPAQSSTADEPAEATPSAPTPKSGSGRPSVAEMMAMARGEKKADAPAAAKARPAAKKAAATASSKLAAKKAPATKSEPVDTSSILAAARKSKSDRPGPMSKAEAAAKGQPTSRKPKKPKEEIFVPPMPVKPEYAKKPADRAKAEAVERRSFLFGMTALAVGFVALGTTGFLWTMGTVRFMFPNVLREPPSRFKVGPPDQFPPGQVETKFKAQFGVWIVNTTYNGEQVIYALKSVCTHLGCTPNWLEGEQKYKCPCHGSGFYKDGINFEGPAPRPLERYAISVASDGQVEVDKSRLFLEEKGEWADAASFLPA